MDKVYVSIPRMGWTNDRIHISFYLVSGTAMFDGKKPTGFPFFEFPLLHTHTGFVYFVNVPNRDINQHPC